MYTQSKMLQQNEQSVVQQMNERLEQRAVGKGRDKYEQVSQMIKWLIN